MFQQQISFAKHNSATVWLKFAAAADQRSQSEPTCSSKWSRNQHLVWSRWLMISGNGNNTFESGFLCEAQFQVYLCGPQIKVYKQRYTSIHTSCTSPSVYISFTRWDLAFLPLCEPGSSNITEAFQRLSHDICGQWFSFVDNWLIVGSRWYVLEIQHLLLPINARDT